MKNDNCWEKGSWLYRQGCCISQRTKILPSGFMYYLKQGRATDDYFHGGTHLLLLIGNLCTNVIVRGEGNFVGAHVNNYLHL